MFKCEFDECAKSHASGPFFGRLFLSLIFLYAGVIKLLNFQEGEALFNQMNIQGGNIYLWIGLVMEIVGGLLILFGWYTRIGCLILMVFLLPTTLIFHSFWNFAGIQREMQLTLFLKNLTIYGGLFLLASYGPGRWSVDCRRRCK